jgi:hypothetical protein
MTDNIIKFQKPVDLHKELDHWMNVISTAEKIFINRMQKPYSEDLDTIKSHASWSITQATIFHRIAKPFIDDIMNKIEKEAK